MKKTLKHIFTLLLVLFLFCLQKNLLGQSITLSSPSTGATMIDNVSATYVITGETGTISKIKLVFTYTDGFYKSNIGKKDSATLVTTASTQTVSFNPTTMTSNASFSSTTGNLPDGTYSIQANYTRSNGAIIKSLINTNIKFDTGTLPPFFIDPKPQATVKGIFAYKDSIPEPYRTNTKILTLQSASTSKTTTITLTNSTRVSKFNFNVAYIPQISIISTTDTTLSDGTYNMTLSYMDTYGHPISTTNQMVTFDSKTLPPSIKKPLNGIRQNNLLELVSFFPEQIKAESAKLIFYNTITGKRDSLLLANVSTGINSFNLDLKNLNSPAISSGSTTTLPDGNYQLMLIYQDLVGNTAKGDTLKNFILDNTTISPTLLTPASNQIINSQDPIDISFTLPEAGYPGSAKINFKNDNTSFPITINTPTSGSHSYQIYPNNLNNSIGTSSSISNSIPDGNYTLSVSYQDIVGNPEAISNTQTILIDRETLPLEIVSPIDSSTISGNLLISVNLPETPLNNKVFLTLRNCEEIKIELEASTSGINNFTINPQNIYATQGVIQSSHLNIPPGTYALIIGYQDSFGNPYSYSTKKEIHF